MGRQGMRQGKRLRHWQRLSDDRRASRLARYEDVKRRHRAGQTLKAIARETSLHYLTIRNFVRSDTFPERAPRNRGPSPLDRYRDHIAGRIAQGLHNPKVLWEEVRAKGYAGSRAVVNALVLRLRSPQTAESLVQIPSRTMPCPSTARVFGWLAGWRKFTGGGEPIKPIHDRFVQALCALEPSVVTVQSLVRQFLGLGAAQQ